MKTIKFISILSLIIGFFLITVSIQSCDEPDCEFPDRDTCTSCDTCMTAYKPNIYIYPEEKTELTVKLNFPKGGQIIKSIPEYNTGWNIEVDEYGVIDDSYTYLFYESKQPNIWQKKEGWIVKKEDLESFFNKNMYRHGFEGMEVKDFLDYWLPKLTDFEYYTIYPQTASIIDQVIELNISEKPDNLLRLFYFIKGYKEAPNKIIIPKIEKFERKGFFVTEWGVIL